MTQATERTLRAYAQAWAAGDLAAVLGAYHDDLVLHWPGTHSLAGVHAGKAAAVTALAAMATRFGRRLVAVEALLAGGDVGVLVTRETFEHAGRSAEFRRVLLFRVADERLRECWVYDADQRAFDAFLS
jgi:uncharacterized protein